MSDSTKIEWADATANYVNGCSVVSPGCTNCYAMRLAGTRMKHHPSRAGLTMDTKAGPVWTGEVRANETALLQPLKWRRPRRIFWNAHGDLFHEAVPDAWIDQAFAVMALTPQHIHMVLTKRPERMRDYLNRRGASPSLPTHEIMQAMDGLCREKWPKLQWPLPNVWLGTSVEDQTRADERIPHLLATPAAKRFLSCEPLLGPVDLNEVPAGPGGKAKALFGPLSGYCQRHFRRTDCGCDKQRPRIHWVIVGGESGPNARPMHPDWVRSLRDQCAAAGVPFFFKQWGEWGRVADQTPPPDHLECDADSLTRCGKSRAGNTLDGRQHLAWPA